MQRGSYFCKNESLLKILPLSPTYLNSQNSPTRHMSRPLTRSMSAAAAATSVCGIFLHAELSDDRVLPTLSGDPPHATLTYTGSRIGKTELVKGACAASPLILMCRGLVLDRVVINTFAPEGLGRNRTDVLWCFDADGQRRMKIAHSAAMEVMSSLSDTDKADQLAQRLRVPYHVTLCTDASPEQVEQWTTWASVSGQVLLTGVYFD
jgi:hypothetical protein